MSKEQYMTLIAAANLTLAMGILVLCFTQNTPLHPFFHTFLICCNIWCAAQVAVR